MREARLRAFGHAYAPRVGGQLSLSVRRNQQTAIWNSQTGLKPKERKDLPFGPCWNSGAAQGAARCASSGGGCCSTFKFSYKPDVSKEVYDPRTGGFSPKAGEPKCISKVELPGGGSATFSMDSRMRFRHGCTSFIGHRSTSITDAAGAKRKYTFTGLSVTFLDRLRAILNIDKLPNPLRKPKMLSFRKMTVEYEKFGDEQFHFSPHTGMAISAARDLSGNATHYTYSDAYHGLPHWADGYPVTTYSDPNIQKRSLDAVKEFEYGAWRSMSKITDEEDRVTKYKLNSLGLRTSETIHSADGDILQTTDFEYDTQFVAFVIQKIVERDDSDGAPPGASPELETDYTADTTGRVATQTQQTGTQALVTTYTYDQNSNRKTVLDPKGYTTSFTYDSQNRLTEIDYPMGASKKFAYDSRSNKITETDENGFQTQFTYDLLNRLTQQRRVMNGTTPSGADLITSYKYNKVNSRTSVTDPNGNVTTTKYDDLQRATRITRPLDDVTKFDYEFSENCGGSVFASSTFMPTTTTDARGYATEVHYDELYRATKKYAQYDLEGDLYALSEMKYDLVNNLLVAKHWTESVSEDGSGSGTPEEVTTVYDGMNRPTTITTAVSGSVSVTREMAYTSTGLQWELIDENGNTYQTYCDGAARKTTAISPPVAGGEPTTYTTYDLNSNVTQVEDPMDNLWNYEYDERNRKTEEIQPSPDGIQPRPTFQYGYDPVGNRTSVEDPRLNTTNTEYDQANRPITVLGPPVSVPGGGTARPTTQTGYDKNGNVTSIIDPDGHETDNVYDTLNRLTSTTDAEDIIVTYTYDTSGNRLTVEDGLGQTTAFTYDGLNRNTTVTDPAGNATTFVYDAINKTTRTDALDQTTTYAYDLRNRVTSIEYAGRSDDNRTYTYDDVGNLLSVTLEGYDGQANVSYTYDALNRVATEMSGGLTHIYSYDLNNNLLSAAFGAGMTVTYTYDDLNRMLTLYDGIRATGYGYDANGNITSQTLADGNSFSATFDALNRRTKLTSPPCTYQQTYDLAGNVVQIQESYPSNPSLNRTIANDYDAIYRLPGETVTAPDGTVISTTTYVYDDGNNRIQRVYNSVTSTYTYGNSLNQLTEWADGTNNVTFTYDVNGCRLTRTAASAVTGYQYDYENRLVSTGPSSSSSSSSSTSGVYSYVYDYRTRRVQRTESGVVTNIIFSGGTSIAEYDSADTLQVQYLRGLNHGGGIGGLLYSLRDGTPAINYYNNRGDVTTQTDSTATVTWQTEYNAFGTHPTEIGSTPDRQKANTKEEDPTGLLNEGFRYRDLESGTFITRDPAGFVDGPNLYTYVRQNPWTKFDPEGLETKEEWQEIVRKDIQENSHVDINNYDPEKGYLTNQQYLLAVFAFYERMYKKDPTDLKWAGLAKIAGGAIMYGLQHMEYSKIGTFFTTFSAAEQARRTQNISKRENILVAMNKAVFKDLAWQNMAYSRKGLAEMQERAKAGEISADYLKYWSQIASGEAWEGNTGLLYMEQHNILAPGYAKLSLTPVVTDLISQFSVSPLPNGTPFRVTVPGGDLANFNDRWKWIVMDMIPKAKAMSAKRFQQLVDTPMGDLMHRAFPPGQ
jgi:RHS repeat-associated protein